MSVQDFISAFIVKRGTPVTILRNAGNISDYCVLSNLTSSQPFTDAIKAKGLFRWDSEVVNGDIFQDTITQSRYIASNLNYWGQDSWKNGKNAFLQKCNDLIGLYQWVEGSVDDSYGKKVFILPTKLNDYAIVFSFLRDDKLEVVGEIALDKLFITFSARNLSGYIPQNGDRIILQNGQRFQIDGIDDHLYSGCYATICSRDSRL